jgi:hypothetical protein
MKRVLDILKAVIISPEVGFIIFLFLLVYLRPDILRNLASQVNTNDETIKFWALVPVSVTIYFFTHRDDLLFPKEERLQEILNDWREYHLLLDRYWICIFWGGLGSLLTLAIWLFKGDLSIPSIFSIFFGGIITPTITFLTFVSATITLKRLLSTYSKKTAKK